VHISCGGLREAEAAGGHAQGARGGDPSNQAGEGADQAPMREQVTPAGDGAE
jgi:hypothetical protein